MSVRHDSTKPTMNETPTHPPFERDDTSVGNTKKLRSQKISLHQTVINEDLGALRSLIKEDKLTIITL